MRKNPLTNLVIFLIIVSAALINFCNLLPKASREQTRVLDWLNLASWYIYPGTLFMPFVMKSKFEDVFGSVVIVSIIAFVSAVALWLAKRRFSEKFRSFGIVALIGYALLSFLTGPISWATFVPWMMR
jgi:putative copper export protein